MILCDACIYYLGGKGIQKGATLCAKKNATKYVFPSELGAPHGYAPKNKRCFTDTPPPPPKLVRKKRVRVKRRRSR